MALSPQEAGLLSGIRVVEAASMIMVPSVGAALADYGAEVIKLEPIEGDLNRRGHLIPGMPLHDYEYCFLPDNRGKRSLAIDLKAPEARAILRRLIEGADVFLTNHRHKSLDGLGMTWPELQAINPRLIYAHGTGFGDSGPEIDKPGFDSVCYWSRSATAAAATRPAWRCFRRCCSRCSRASAPARARGCPARCSPAAPGRTRS